MWSDRSHGAESSWIGNRRLDNQEVSLCQGQSTEGNWPSRAYDAAAHAGAVLLLVLNPDPSRKSGIQAKSDTVPLGAVLRHLQPFSASELHSTQMQYGGEQVEHAERGFIRVPDPNISDWRLRLAGCEPMTFLINCLTRNKLDGGGALRKAAAFR
ncbi:uncharacterized protein B0I36DRAFT_426696 [Microdochium trichocladiopsis]|uniref:Uncharacterized protein n=1 Tax=Microdochium trichocladiopsis TaxID=1682393 RepID=A0A9P8YIW9_9PEZI|nr:uncharacterized protein B0I36DRAFT_426696 [Microdochium trichocladiopsis]KAH7040186.1 hypothetical protein B0I36DRAFT_426696 [Microdochium trichocladiopsis]